MRFLVSGILISFLISAASLDAPAYGQKASSVESSVNIATSAGERKLTGKILAFKGSLLQLETRDKRTVQVNPAPAIKSHRANALVVGAFITAYGAYDSNGVLHAQAIQRAKRGPAAWPADH